MLIGLPAILPQDHVPIAQGLPNPDGIELSGSWAARNFTDAIGNMPGGGPRPVEYMGIPLNDTGRAWSLIYSQSQVSMPERICDYYAPTYIAIGPMGLRIWPESEAPAIWATGSPNPYQHGSLSRPHVSPN